MIKIKKLYIALGLAGLCSIQTLAATVETRGFLKFECWFPPIREAAFTGAQIYALESDPNYVSNTPDMISYAAGWNSRTVFPDDTHEQYGSRISGWITPAITGDYNFFLSSDDNGQLWIGTDATAASLQLVAEEFGSDSAFSDLGASQTTMAPIHLVAGQKYAIQSLQKENTGNDFTKVAWQVSTDLSPASSLQPLSGIMLSSIAESTGASLTITQQPSATNTVENRSATFSIAATAVTPWQKYSTGGTPVQDSTPPLGVATQIDAFYQWYTNGVAVEGANGTNYTVSSPKVATDNGMKVKCYVAVPGIPLYSSEVTLTVIPDTVAPTVSNIEFGLGMNSISITFDEPLDPVSAAAFSNYSLNNGLTLDSIIFNPDTPTKVTLKTSQQTPGAAYEITINGVMDTSGNPLVQYTKSFHGLEVDPGFLIQEYYGGIDGLTTTDLTGSVKFINGTPDSVRTVYSSEVPLFFPDNPDANGTRMFGFVIPEVSGAYTFYVAGYNGVELYLSTNADPANKVLIATDTDEFGVQGGTGVHEWTKYASQKSAPQMLTAGEKYFIEGLHKQNSGAENFGIAWTKPGEAATTINVIPGKYLAGYSNPDFQPALTITKQPVNTTVAAGKQAVFTVAATGQSAYGTNVGFQWQKNGSDIDGAITSTYVTPFAVLGDSGTKFKCVVMVAGKKEASAEVTLTVNAESSPFVPTAASRLEYPGYSEITVTFSKPLLNVGDPNAVNVTSTNAANYAIDHGVMVSNVALWDERTVILTTTPISAGQTYNLAVNNVVDLAGNPVTANSRIALQDPLSPRQQDEGPDGLIVAEVERFDRNMSRNNAYWTNTTLYTGFSGECGMQAMPDAGKNGGSTNTISPRLDYQVNFVQTGTLYMWMRGTAPFGGSSDSVFMGADGLLATQNNDPASGRAMDGFNYDGTYKWSRRNQLEITTTGLHVLSVWMREDGFVADKILFSMNPAYSPVDMGPEDTRPAPAPAVSISIMRSGSNVILSWNKANGAGYSLMRSDATGAGAVWVLENQPVDNSGQNSTITIPAADAARFYQLRN